MSDRGYQKPEEKHICTLEDVKIRGQQANTRNSSDYITSGICISSVARECRLGEVFEAHGCGTKTKTISECVFKLVVSDRHILTLNVIK